MYILSDVSLWTSSPSVLWIDRCKKLLLNIVCSVDQSRFEVASHLPFPIGFAKPSEFSNLQSLLVVLELFLVDETSLLYW